MESTSDSGSQSSTDFIQSSAIVSDYDKLIRAALNSRAVVLLNNLKLEQVVSHREQITPVCIKQEPVDIIPHLQGYDEQQDYIQTDMSLIDLKPTDVEITLSSESYEIRMEIFPSLLRYHPADHEIYLLPQCVASLHFCKSGELLSRLVSKPENFIGAIGTSASVQRQDLTTSNDNLKCKKSYKCDQCDHQTSQYSHLTKHIRTHTGERPYKCDQCDYQTVRKGNLTRHIKTQTGGKPYKCDQCDYQTTQDSHLTKHMRTHTGEKPYKCDQCDYQTVQIGNLTRHIKTHTDEKPYKCDHCDYQTTQDSNLTQHIRTHTGEKPYKCGHCDYQAAQKRCLTIHIRTHTGERTYKCDQCAYQTTNKSNLFRHSRTHTGEKP